MVKEKRESSVTTKVNAEDKKADKKLSVDSEENEKATDVAEYFYQNTTAHGFKHAASKERSRFVRCLWWLAIMTATGALLSTLWEQKENLFKYPSRAVLDVKFVKELAFPAVTICNLNEFDHRKANNLPNVTDGGMKVQHLVLTESVLREKELKEYLEDPDYQDILNVSLQDVYRVVSPTVNETFKYCSWQNVHLPCESILKRIFTFDGVCFQFNGNGSSPISTTALGPLTGLTLIADVGQVGYNVGTMLSAGLKVLLHEPGTFPDVAAQGFLVSPGMTTFTSIHYQNTRHLPYPYKSYGEEYCEEDVMEYGYVYNRDSCIAECLYAAVFRRCNCSITTDEEENENKAERKCTYRDDLACLRPELLTSYTNAAMKKNVCTSCKYSCEVTKYVTSSSYAVFPSDNAMKILRKGLLDYGLNSVFVRSNVLELRIFYDRMVREEISYEPEYTWDSIIGNVGGQMGLFMGASLLTLGEIIECLFFAMIALGRWCIQKMSGERKDTTKVDSMKVEQDL